jgi:hypothetical protein
MKKLLKPLLGSVLILASLHSQGALITDTSSFSLNANASTFRSSEPTTGFVIDESTISLASFDSTLGTLTEVSFSYTLFARFSGSLQVYDPSSGVTSEEDVHGRGVSAFAYSLIADSEFPSNFNKIIDKEEYDLECNEDSALFDNILNPQNGQCSDSHDSYYGRFTDTLTYNSEEDFAYFLDEALEFTYTAFAGVEIEFCDDDEDWCQMSSTLSFGGGLELNYEYTPFTDDTPGPISEVSAPTGLALLSVGLLGVMRRHRRLGVTVTES